MLSQKKKINLCNIVLCYILETQQELSCNRSLYLEEKVYEVVFRQLKEASHSQALYLMRVFNHPNICCKSNTAEATQISGVH